MHTSWTEPTGQQSVTAPLTLNITAYSGVTDIRGTLTPQLRNPKQEQQTRLLLIEMPGPGHRLGGSALAQVHNQLGDAAPDIDDALALKELFNCVQQLAIDARLLAYHDRSDGGLMVAALEMAFAARCGLELDVTDLVQDATGVAVDAYSLLFNEELGALVQVRQSQVAGIIEFINSQSLRVCDVGWPRGDQQIRVSYAGELLLESDRAQLQAEWARTSYQMQRLRDNPACADSEFDQIAARDPGFSAALSFDPNDDICAPYINRGAKPLAAILREQGVNGHLEMAAAFESAGFAPVDVHMSQLLQAPEQLAQFNVLAACGGFSYGDVLGGGGGWAKSILFAPRLRDAFAGYFARSTLTLGVCNGCQMLAGLAELIPQAEDWPMFVQNSSQRFEARTSLVQIASDTTSPWLSGMAGSVLPVALAHGEGRAEYRQASGAVTKATPGAVLRYVDNHHQVTQSYPANPNGSPAGVAGVSAADGRVIALMPHPERVVRSVQNSWVDESWGEDGPWLRLFRNARVALG